MKKFVNIIEGPGILGNYESFSEDTFTFWGTVEFLREEQWDYKTNCYNYSRPL